MATVPKGRQGVSSDAGAEGERRIPLGRFGEGVPDSEAGGDAGSSDRGVESAARGEVAREEGEGAEAGLNGLRTCTSCWFDSHHCVGNRRCACWVCRTEAEINMMGMPQDTVELDLQEGGG